MLVYAKESFLMFFSELLLLQKYQRVPISLLLRSSCYIFYLQVTKAAEDEIMVYDPLSEMWERKRVKKVPPL